MAYGEDEEPRKPQRFTKLPLDGLGVAELQSYIAELQAEIARADAEIARKQGVRSEAARFFKT